MLLWSSRPFQGRELIAGAGVGGVRRKAYLMLSYLGNEEQESEGQDVTRSKCLVITIYQGCINVWQKESVTA